MMDGSGASKFIPIIVLNISGPMEIYRYMSPLIYQDQKKMICMVVYIIH